MAHGMGLPIPGTIPGMQGYGGYPMGAAGTGGAYGQGRQGGPNAPYMQMMAAALFQYLANGPGQTARNSRSGGSSQSFNSAANRRAGNGFLAQSNAALMDPALTVEDKVALLIMLIMKKMDQDIERQANYVNQLQQRQGKGGKGASTSIDVETMKLKRMIDKRSQMFDMLRQIIDKYNQTAKGIIDSMGR